jgi:hypothetical protein
MKILKTVRAYKYQITITASILGVFFLFQNGSCGSGDVASGSSTTSASTTSTTTTASTLTITPSNTNVALGGTIQFAASGGTLPYIYTSLSGVGTFSGALYYAPSTAGTYGVQVTDSSSPVQYSYATITVASTATTTIVISPATSTVAASSSFQFSASGGTAPYSYIHTAGAGSLSSTGYFTAAAYAATDVITVTDSLGFMSQVTITTSAASTTTASTTISISSISTNNQLTQTVNKVTTVIWPVANMLKNSTGNDMNSCYSSTEFNNAVPQGTKPAVLVNIYPTSSSTSTPVNVDHIIFRARFATSASFVTSVISFPSSYTLSYMNAAGAYVSLGTFTNQPDSTTGIVDIPFGSVVTAKQIVMVANTIGKDGNGNLYFQLCGVSF